MNLYLMAFGSRRTVLPFLALPSPLAAVGFLCEGPQSFAPGQIELKASQDYFDLVVSTCLRLTNRYQNRPLPAFALLIDTAYRLPGSNQATRQRNSNCFLPEFSRAFPSHSHSPFASSMRLKERHNSATGPAWWGGLNHPRGDSRVGHRSSRHHGVECWDTSDVCRSVRAYPQVHRCDRAVRGVAELYLPGA